MFEPKAGERNQAGKVTRRENGRRKAESAKQRKKAIKQCTNSFPGLVGWKMVHLRPAKPGAAARCLSASQTWSEGTTFCLGGMRSGTARYVDPPGFPRIRGFCAD